MLYVDSRIALDDLQATNTLVVTADCAYSNTGEGLHRFVDPADDKVYLYSQFEVPDARRVFTTFEQPDLKAPYRFEVTSAFRSAADQARLRRTNDNAARGVSTHEFGTTVDIAYFSFATPAELPAGLIADGPAWLRPYQEAMARAALETVAGQKSRELQKILGDVLRDAQSDGQVLVTLERLQPVYHITVARRLADPPG